MDRDLGLRGERLAEALKRELGHQSQLWADLTLDLVPARIALNYQPGVVRWVVHGVRSLRDQTAGFTYTVQRGHNAVATVFEDPVLQRAEMVCDALNRLEDLAAEGSSDQADGAG